MENGYRRTITIAIACIVILLGIAAAIPFKTVSYQAMETYYEDGVRQETYTAKEPYTVQEPVTRQETIYSERPFSVPNGVNVPVVITKPDSELSGHFALPGGGGVRIILPSKKILFEQLGQSGDFQVLLQPGNYTVNLRDSRIWGQPVFLSLTVKWTEVGDVTKYREVTKTHDVPAQVEKQRLTTKNKKASLWELIFGLKP